MIARVIPSLALCALFGCVGARQTSEADRPDAVSRQVVATPRATYVLARSRMHMNRAAEIEQDIAEQRALLRELIEKRQNLPTEAKYLRHYESGLRTIRESHARNLEGETYHIDKEIENRRRLIKTLQDRASSHYRQAAMADRLTADILRHPTPVDTPFIQASGRGGRGRGGRRRANGDEEPGATLGSY